MTLAVLSERSKWGRHLSPRLRAVLLTVDQLAQGLHKSVAIIRSDSYVMVYEVQPSAVVMRRVLHAAQQWPPR